MSQIYKVLKDFELDGEAVRTGQEVVCRAREAEKLQKEGYLVPSTRDLDPKDKKDAALLAKSDERAQKRHDTITGKEAQRGEMKNDREAENDVNRAAKVQKASDLHQKLTGESEKPSRFEGLTEAELDKEIADLNSKLPTEVDEEELGKYKITGKAEYTDEKGVVQGELEVGSVQVLPIVIGNKFISEGVAEAYTEPAPAAKRKARNSKK